MEYVYAALILHETGEEINEDNLSAVIEAAGADVDIEEAVEQAAAVPAAGGAGGAPAEEAGGDEGGEEAAEEGGDEAAEEAADEEEEDVSGEGLGDLFG